MYIETLLKHICKMQYVFTYINIFLSVYAWHFFNVYFKSKSLSIYTYITMKIKSIVILLMS